MSSVSIETSPKLFDHPAWTALFHRRLAALGEDVVGRIGVERHPAWLAAWAEAFRLNEKNLRLLVWKSSAGTDWSAVGAFHLSAEGPLRVLRFVGSGLCLYDHQDVLCELGREEEAGKLLAQAALSLQTEWGAVELEYVPERGPAAESFLAELAGAGLKTEIIEADRVPHTDAHPNFDAYRRAELSKKLWDDLRRRKRRFEETFGPLRFETVSSADKNAETQLHDFFALHTNWWRSRNRQSGVLDAFPQWAAFCAAARRRFAVAADDQVECLLQRLYLVRSGETAAYHFGFRLRHTVSFVTPAANPDFAAHEPGKLLLLHAAEQTFGEKAPGAERFCLELGRGTEDYKSRWARRSFAVRTLRAYKAGRRIFFTPMGRKATGAAVKTKRKADHAAAGFFRLLTEGRSGSAAVYPQLTARLPGPRLMCLAPHPDDETLGCGGTLRKHVLAGDEAFVVFLTDGGGGDPQANDALARRTCAERRACEAQNALEVLGVKQTSFFGFPDGRLSGNIPSAAEKLASLISDFRPDLVCLPHPFDNHPDHDVVFDLVAQAVKSAHANFLVAAYEVWTPLAANLLVDITQQMEIKETALRKYESQISVLDYVERVRGLNAYRSLSWPKLSRYAEAFYVAPWPDFANLIERIRKP
jgi:LmbE family N-acetylglucosaminyl deacetylase/CelD/BcsL family acetyltransferase involved in cellulose biosynthesis